MDVSIKGIGNVLTNAIGKGTVELNSEIGGQQYVLTLEDVLHVPTNPQNLLSLGCWDNSGGRYQGGSGQLSLITKDKRLVATGTKINNHLYKMNKLTERK